MNQNISVLKRGLVSNEEYEHLRYNIASSHLFVQCHPETCSCPTDFVVTETVQKRYHPEENEWDQHVKYVGSSEEGRQLINKLEANRGRLL